MHLMNMLVMKAISLGAFIASFKLDSITMYLPDFLLNSPLFSPN